MKGFVSKAKSKRSTTDLPSQSFKPTLKHLSNLSLCHKLLKFPGYFPFGSACQYFTWKLTVAFLRKACGGSADPEDGRQWSRLNPAQIMMCHGGLGDESGCSAQNWMLNFKWPDSLKVTPDVCCCPRQKREFWVGKHLTAEQVKT